MGPESCWGSLSQGADPGAHSWNILPALGLLLSGSPFWNWLLVLWSSAMSFLVVCLLSLSVSDGGVLKSPTLIVDSSIYLSLSFLQFEYDTSGCREGFPGGAGGKEPTQQCRRHKDTGWIPGLGRSPGGGPSSPLQYSCLESPTDRGAW